MSSEIYELMKRSDEGAVVEKAHRRPRFVEDCVREMIRGVVERVRRPGGRSTSSPPARRTSRRSTSTTSSAERFGLLGELRQEIATGEHSRTTCRCASGSTRRALAPRGARGAAAGQRAEGGDVQARAAQARCAQAPAPGRSPWPSRQDVGHRVRAPRRRAPHPCGGGWGLPDEEHSDTPVLIAGRPAASGRAGPRRAPQARRSRTATSRRGMTRARITGHRSPASPVREDHGRRHDRPGHRHHGPGRGGGRQGIGGRSNQPDSMSRARFAPRRAGEAASAGRTTARSRPGRRSSGTPERSAKAC